jgi:hypothetical protein
MRWSMGEARYERHANRMAPLGDTLVRWPVRDARLWEMYADEIAVYGIYTLRDVRL